MIRKTTKISNGVLKKLIVILGPTASGKSDLAVKLARKFNGEIVSADSRQVYRGMDIGTGKVPRDKNWKLDATHPPPFGNWKLYYHKGIPHYLLDVASPKRRFTVAQYQKLALKAINKIHKKNRVPFLVGGTGFYIQAVVDGISIPKVKPDWNLRKKLEKKPVSELYKTLLKLDPDRAAHIDRNNPRRIIRALEIVLKSKGPVPTPILQKPKFKALFLGVKKEPKELKKLIEKRLLKRLGEGMIDEVKKLHRSGVSFKCLEEFGLEYRFISQYLQKKITYNEMLEKIQKQSEHFAKRQMTWFKRDNRICWIKNYKEAKKLVKEFLQ